MSWREGGEDKGSEGGRGQKGSINTPLTALNHFVIIQRERGSPSSPVSGVTSRCDAGEKVARLRPETKDACGTGGETEGEGDAMRPNFLWQSPCSCCRCRGQTPMSLVPEPQVNLPPFHMINPDNWVLIASMVDGIQFSGAQIPKQTAQQQPRAEPG